MTNLYFRIDGPGRDRVPATSTSIADVRSEAVKYLGSYLVDHPHFADEGYWRLIVENEYGMAMLHVIVATVTNRTKS